MIARGAAFAAVLAVGMAAGVATASPRTFRPRCADHSCRSFVEVDASGHPLGGTTPRGFGPADLQSAYRIDPTLGADATVAVVDAYGYKALEADLAVYRAQFGLPACSVASGCLTIVNGQNETGPLPPEDADWIGETALDVDMVSAACPLCKIVVVQGDTNSVLAFRISQQTAVARGATSISNSWDGAEFGGELDEEEDFNKPGIGTFVSSGDYGYDMAFPGDSVPAYPSTSAHVIAVGGTHLVQVDPSVDPRGWMETAWGQAGSSCSTSIPKPAFQDASVPCAMRAASDIAANADPQTGVAVYIAGQGGWQIYGGTSEASPLSAAVFAAAGHGDAVPALVYKHPELFHDVVSGTNGPCVTAMCIARAGWDGPTGVGSIDQAALVALGNVAGAGPDLQFTYPAEGATVAPSSGVEVTAGSDASYVALAIDDVFVAAQNTPPYEFSAPVPPGDHVLTATAYDLERDSKSTDLHVTIAADASGDDGGGGCAVGGGGRGPRGLGGVTGGLLVLGALRLGRRRRPQ